MIRVMLIDDQTLVRQGIRRLLELADDIDVIAEAAAGDEALALLESATPDVLLLDIRMPGMSGVELLEELQRRETPIPTVILTTFADDEALVAALRAGAGGYLLKDCSLDDLLNAVRGVAKGERFVQPVALAKILPGLDRIRGETAPPLDELTPREKDVLQLMASGSTNREIADALGNTEGTIKNHVSNILLKLGARDRTQAVLKGIEYRLL